MKKLLTIALATSMILAMSVNSFALGNYVLSTDELGQEETQTEETPVVEEPAEETVSDTPKVNPNTALRTLLVSLLPLRLLLASASSL